MKDYNVTVSRTGGITIKAESSLAAVKMVRAMSTEETEKLAEFCDYEVLDVCEVPEPVYYYWVTAGEHNAKYFFRSPKPLADADSVVKYLASKKKVKYHKSKVLWFEYPDEEAYRSEIISHLKKHFDRERDEYHAALKELSADDIISSAGKILFYDDVIHELDDRTNDDFYSIKEIEKLLDMEKPLDYLYEKKYIKLDFSNINEQMIGIINSEG